MLLSFDINLPFLLCFWSCKINLISKDLILFYGDLVYKFRKIIGKNDFPYHFKKIIVRYKMIGYNIDVLRQTACLVVYPIKVNNLPLKVSCLPL